MFILFMLAGCTNDKDITEIIPQSMDSSMETPNEVEQNDTGMYLKSLLMKNILVSFLR